MARVTDPDLRRQARHRPRRSTVPPLTLLELAAAALTWVLLADTAGAYSKGPMAAADMAVWLVPVIPSVIHADCPGS